MQLLNKSMLAAMMFGASVAMAYDEVTDNTGATEPPRGQADNSFVEGVYPPGSPQDQEAQSQESRSGPTYQGTDVSIEGSAEGHDTSTGAVSGSLFGQLDEDSDGNVSRYEARDQNELVQSFDDVDQDNDGVLSADELQNWQDSQGIEESR